MKQISSNLTPLLKYVLPWTIIIILIVGTIAAFLTGQFYLGVGVIVIGAPVVGFLRTMLMQLKNVFIDKEHKLLIVKGATDESIPYDDIKEILNPWTPPYITTVQVTKEYSFGKTFTFLPDGHSISWDNYDDSLKTKIRN